MTDKHFDPFKAALAERIESMQKVLHGIEAQSEIIRERVFRPEKHLVPKFNILYDSLRTPNAWRYMADAAAKGTITTVQNGTAQVPVTLLKQPLLRLSQWPNAVQVHLVIRFFGLVPQGIPTGNGTNEVFFFDNAGIPVPLGEFLAQSGGNSVYDHILPTPVTDSLSSGSPATATTGNEGPSVGFLSVFASNTAGISQVYNWSMSFSLAYLLPSSYAYELRSDVAQPVEQHKGNGHIIVEGNY